MVIWVKTTIDIADGLLTEAKQRAGAEGTTLRAYVERGLRAVLNDAKSPERVEYRPVTFELEPLPGVDPYDWDAIYDSIYDGP
jgi:Arc/MetJ family transcription regulator